MTLKLSEEQKIAVITALACFDRPSVVIAMMKKQYGIEMITSHVTYYDPTTYAGRKLKPKYADLFRDTREAFRAGAMEIPIAEKATRLRMLGDIAGEARDTGNLKMALRAVEQAAKEMGEVYTNKVQATVQGEITGSYTLTGGLPDIPLGNLDPEERDRVIEAAKQPRECEIKANSSEHVIDPALVEEDQLLASATPEERAAWEERQEKKRLIAMGLITE